MGRVRVYAEVNWAVGVAGIVLLVYLGQLRQDMSGKCWETRYKVFFCVFVLIHASKGGTTRTCDGVVSVGLVLCQRKLFFLHL